MKAFKPSLLLAILVASGFLWFLAHGAAQVAGDGYTVFFGTYTRQESKGIYAFRFNPSTGKSTPIGLVGETSNPSFLAIHPKRRFLYAVNEVSTYGGEKSGSVSAFSIDHQTAALTLLNTVPTRGASPCHVVVDQSGRWLFVANYGGGSVAVFPVDADGRLGQASGFVQHTGNSVHPQRQQGPHAHQVALSPDGRFALVADLGLDKILVYQFDPSKGALVPGNPPFTGIEPGSGPRHLAFHPNGRWAYVISELRSTVTAFAYHPENSTFEALQTLSTLPKDFSGNSSGAEITVHPSGRFLYGSNRGHDSIAVYSIDSGKGVLTPVEHVSVQGNTPRHFTIDPSGGYLFAANQNTDNVVVFRIHRQSGRLTPSGETLKVPSPVCVTFLESR